jgi:L-threonylcarbamoyladenylate synthase
MKLVHIPRVIEEEIKLAVELLKNNEVVAIPTETVYGLAGNAYSEEAIMKIFEVKNRPYFNPLIVHIKSIFELPEIAKNISDIAWKLAHEFWPGPLTLVLEKQDFISSLITGGKSTVAVRVPRHPVALQLLASIDFPLVAPSANPFNYLSPTTAAHVQRQLGDKIPLILDGGKCEKGVESTIIGFRQNKPVLLRLGAISKEEIEAVVGELSIQNESKQLPDSPGMLEKHYSPRTPIYVTPNVSELIKKNLNKRLGTLMFQKRLFNKSVIHNEVLSNKGNLYEAASNLFEALHRLDNMALDMIITEQFPDIGLGKTINDRLQRACKLS